MNEIVQALEEKVGRAESELYKHFDRAKAKEEDIAVLKHVIKTSQEKVSKLESDIKSSIKASKAKEKEIYNLENKNENQQDSLQRLKDKLNQANIEKAKSEKELKRMKKNLKPEIKDKNPNSNPVAKQSKTKAKTDDENPDANASPNSLPVPVLKTPIMPAPTDSLRQVSETETNAQDDHDTKEDEFSCEVCNDIFSCEAELHNHWKDHHGGVKYDCTLCNQIFRIEEDYIQHRNSNGHVKLSEAVVSEFRKQIGDCQDCHIIESNLNTSYSFCENDGHIEAFHLIWNSVKSGSMPSKC